MHELLRLIVVATVAALFPVAWQGASAQQPDIVGTWEWTRKKDNCLERYVYRADGTLTVRRGEERTENTYLMSWAPEPGGRYKVTVVTVKDDGGGDCDGSTEDGSGQRRIVYVLFGQSRETMIQCDSPSGADCIGILTRTGR